MCEKFIGLILLAHLLEAVTLEVEDVDQAGGGVNACNLWLIDFQNHLSVGYLFGFAGASAGQDNGNHWWLDQHTWSGKRLMLILDLFSALIVLFYSSMF